VERIQQAEVEALDAILTIWHTGSEPQAIGWATSLLEEIARRFEGSDPPTDDDERISALRIVALASGALPRLIDEVGSDASSDLGRIASRFESAIKALLVAP
jgi:hypothetical protein